MDPLPTTRRAEQPPNSRASSLPSELFSNIFERSLADSFISQGEPLDAFRTLENILNVTHVCHRWREIAVADSRLWSTVILSWPGEAIEAFITRSNGVRLRFVLNMLNRHDDFYADSDLSIPQLRGIGTLISRNMAKIGALELALLVSECTLDLKSDGDGATDCLLSEICSPFLHSEAPSLERLTLSTQCDAEHSTFAVEHLFQGKASNLRDMKLLGNHIRFTEVSLPTLTTVHFDLSGVNGVLYHLMVIPPLLSQLPRVKTVSLEHHPEHLTANEILAFRSPTDSPKFVLQTITYMKMDGLDGHEIGQLFSRIELPALRTLITCPPTEDSIELTAIPRFPLWMHTFFKDVPHVTLCFDQVGIRIESPIGDTEDLFTWQIHDTYVSPESVSICLEWCSKNLELLNPESLRIIRAPDLVECYAPQADQWEDVLSSFPRLSSITVDGKIRIVSLIEALTTSELVPALREFHIHEALFIGKLLYCMLHQRRVNNAGIRRLHLNMRGCTLYEAFDIKCEKVNEDDEEFTGYDPNNIVEAFSGDADFLEHNSVRGFGDADWNDDVTSIEYNRFFDFGLFRWTGGWHHDF
ncbi:hypothetical protein SISSUDRAFT_1055965 [Sistotremastrum suecicum HHB10207 ss-3]|uniref:F-box domain-containing protein n=1 Tax=Sistotremastrum suecicum HHB10207 ss-3 TaxID=1314776 RepID=A0A165XES4_9AGAM|nr:hypothetical protein SISSUDRAFT_1055965 [Sistotremastrum suecicum HHB10207 ss-3]